MKLRPFDLIWIEDASALHLPETAEWVSWRWRPELPLWVRRGVQQQGRIPVTVTGIRPNERAEGWVDAAAVREMITPERLVSDRQTLLHSIFVSLAPVQALILLAQERWPWEWGVIGPCAYALATEIPLMHQDSPLDIVLRCPQPQPIEAFDDLRAFCRRLPCAVKIQAETPAGGFALDAWRAGEPVALETDQGIRQARDPWAPQG